MKAIFDRPIHIGSSVKIDEYFCLISDAFYRGEVKILLYLVQAMLEEIKVVSKQPFLQNPHFADFIALRKIFMPNLHKIGQ